MKLEEIQDLIKFVSRAGVSEVDIQQKDFRIIIKTEDKKRRKEEAPVYIQSAVPVAPVAAALPVAAPVALPAQAAETTTADKKSQADSAAEARYVTIKSPMIGTFYRKPTPDKPAFLEVGDTVKAGDVVCIIEAMKLFNEIESEISGKVVKVLVDDTSPVEYDQPLFLVDPS
jgi:acetyl-CoA carboxylase biotin carboxyl carrier protein